MILPPGDVGYTGTFPDCKFVKPKKCRRPLIGTFPNCFKTPCPPGYFGAYPKCKRPAGQPICPFDSIGAFPNCKIEKSPGESTSQMIVPPSLQSSSSSSPRPPTTQHPLTAFNKMGKSYKSFDLEDLQCFMLYAFPASQ